MHIDFKKLEGTLISTQIHCSVHSIGADSLREF